MIRVGIIGLGMMGRMHYANWERIKGARVIAIADIDPRRAAGDLSGGWSNIAGGAESLDMARIRGSVPPLEMIAWSDVDVVDICVPTPFHAEYAVAALEAGKHCVCEKPIARTLAQARSIVAAAAKSKGFCLPAMCMRFWPQWAWLRDRVQRGTYGKVLDASFRRIGSMPGGWFRDGEMSGGAILDLHLHDTDFVKYVFGAPSAVQSWGYKYVTGCVDQVITRYFYDDDGPVVTAEGSWGMADGFGFQMSYCVNFEKATAEYIMARQDPLILYRKGEALPVTCYGSDGYLAELSHLAQSIRTGKKPTVVTPPDAMESLVIVEAERRSVETGRRVRVNLG